jgi:hypothetical protein
MFSPALTLEADADGACVVVRVSDRVSSAQNIVLFYTNSQPSSDEPVACTMLRA